MYKKQSATQEFQDSWNMNLAFLMRLDTRLEDANNAANQGALTQWYRCLRTIYRIIHHKLVESETSEKKDKKETTIEALNNQFKKAKGSLSKDFGRQINHMNLQNVEELLDEIDIRLNDLIIEHGFIKLDKEGHKHGEAILDKFK